MTNSKSSPTSQCSSAEIRRQLDRILGYPELQSNERRQSMLRYIVEESLAGRSSKLKATSIAMDVFGRGSDFDQQMDPVVRLEARKLRRDLDHYYAGAGRNDPIRISIPKGRYVPRFSKPQGADTFEVGGSGNVETTTPGTIVGSAETVSTVAAFSPPPNTPARRPYLSFVSLFAALVACAALALVWTNFQGENRIAAAEPPVNGAKILVEGFQTLGNDELVSLLAAGLSEEVVAYLLKFPDLRVHLLESEVATTTDETKLTGLRSLTQYALSGSVRQEGNEIIVRSELIRTDDAEVLWSERFTVGVEDAGITNIKDQIASQVASKIGQQYGIVRSELVEMLVSMEAEPTVADYACVARAQIYRRNLHPEQYPEARACLEETVRNQPEYARAWAMLAYLRNDAVRFGYEKGLPADEALVPAREAASRALSFDPFDTDALKAMSHIEHYDGNFERAIDYARFAVEANPNDPETIGNLGFMLGMRGRFEEAVPFLKLAIERSVSPAPRYYQMLAVNHLMKKEWEEMLSASYLAVADDSSVSYSFLAIAHAALGDDAAARANWEKMAERWPLLAENPRAAYGVHKLDPDVTEALVAGLLETAPSAQN